ncbi:hypothetical protein D9758_011268 [Tetrapyrgos nigripes]|uniref:Uncharacterized protein n=1 Tax=Tetrapyrgos nigripes TaxID=182062 RepID=A0A8H5FRY7_9AGAR|nr:hypothetical protein D9758_011268 [Tetrapyrgos nigripes]
MAFDEVGRTMGWPDKCDGRALVNNIVMDLDEGLGLDARLKRFDESTASGDKSRLVVWAGEGVGLTNNISSASDVVRQLHKDAVSALKSGFQLVAEV